MRSHTLIIVIIRTYKNGLYNFHYTIKYIFFFYVHSHTFGCSLRSARCKSSYTNITYLNQAHSIHKYFNNFFLLLLLLTQSIAIGLVLRRYYESKYITVALSYERTVKQNTQTHSGTPIDAHTI